MRNLNYRILFIFLFGYFFVNGQIETKYVIKNITALTGEMYVNSKQVSTQTCRSNVANTKVILKFEGRAPAIFRDDTIYSHRQIIEEIAKVEWSGYSGGLKVVGKYLVTDNIYKGLFVIKINEWMHVKPVRIKDDLWIIPYSLYLKYQTIININISPDKYTIRNVRRREFIKP